MKQISHSPLACFIQLFKLVGDYDSWYVSAKTKLNYSQHESLALIPNNPSIANIARDAVSFHYVSQRESLLLHEILSKPAESLIARELKHRWPSTSEEIGHYSRKVRSNEEYDLLLEAITKRLKVDDQCA
jgi:hypothetical protein